MQLYRREKELKGKGIASSSSIIEENFKKCSTSNINKKNPAPNDENDVANSPTSGPTYIDGLFENKNDSNHAMPSMFPSENEVFYDFNPEGKFDADFDVGRLAMLTDYARQYIPNEGMISQDAPESKGDGAGVKVCAQYIRYTSSNIYPCAFIVKLSI